MNVVAMLAVLSLLPLYQTISPACLVVLTRHCPCLLEDHCLPSPPYQPLFLLYTIARVSASVCDIIKLVQDDILPAIVVANISIGLLIDMLDTIQDLTLMLVTGCATSCLTSRVVFMTTLSNHKKYESRLRYLALEGLKTYQQIAKGLGPILLVAISIKSLFTTISCYFALQRQTSLFGVPQQALYATNAFLVTLYLVLVCEDCYKSLQAIQPIIRQVFHFYILSSIVFHKSSLLYVFLIYC